MAELTDSQRRLFTAPNVMHVATVVKETLEGEEARVVIDRLSDNYTGKPFAMRSGIVYLVEPGKVQEMELPFEPRV